MGYGVRFDGWYNPEDYDPHDSVGKGQVAVDFQNYMAVYNPLGICKFIVKGKIEPQHVANLVNTALGWNWTAEDVMVTGERLFNLKRLINLRFGIGRADDRLPTRLLSEPRPSGAAQGVLPDLDLMLEDYYDIRGWTPEGAPSPERLSALGLE
jgi:aldehyde:ferredoxin oxidoreductase